MLEGWKRVRELREEGTAESDEEVRVEG